MRSFKLILVAFTVCCICKTAASQNVMMNIMTQDAGIVKKGKTVFLEVTINNTDLSSHIGVYKIRTQISVPSDIISIADSGHVLPNGWTVTANTGSSIMISNGKDMIAAKDARTILIALRGNKTGGPSTITGTLSFSNGEAPGTTAGLIKGDNPGDNSSTTTCKVIN